jgi:hypothetical protein
MPRPYGFTVPKPTRLQGSPRKVIAFFVIYFGGIKSSPHHTKNLYIDSPRREFGLFDGA